MLIWNLKIFDKIANDYGRHADFQREKKKPYTLQSRGRGVKLAGRKAMEKKDKKREQSKRKGQTPS
jgi:hypothetical protein